MTFQQRDTVDKLKPGEWRGISFQSAEPQTPFAPEWRFTIGEKDVSNRVDVVAFRDYLLEKEQELISKYPAGSDGSTKLGPNSVTSRFEHFNLMTFDHPCVHALKAQIKKFHRQYCKSVVSLTYRDPGRMRIRSWFNVMRKGQRIQKHLHSMHAHTYLGGHFTVACDNSSTIYVNPYDHANTPDIERRIFKQGEGYDTQSFYNGVNVPGKLTLFPNYLPHFTTKHMSDTERITIAFDITPIPQMFQSDKTDLPLLNKAREPIEDAEWRDSHDIL